MKNVLTVHLYLQMRLREVEELAPGHTVKEFKPRVNPIPKATTLCCLKQLPRPGRKALPRAGGQETPEVATP